MRGFGGLVSVDVKYFTRLDGINQLQSTKYEYYSCLRYQACKSRVLFSGLYCPM